MIIPFLMLLLYGCTAVTDDDQTDSDFKDFQWTMINVNSGPQGDAHLIHIRNGKTILIDTGYPERAETDLIPYLIEKHIQNIDILFISHPHIDHYGGIIPLLNHGINIKVVYFNIPTEERCNEENWGCNANDLLEIRQNLETHAIPIHEAKQGMFFDLGNHSSIEILYAFHRENAPVEGIDLNDESLIMLVHHQQYRFLFTGDLNNAIGQYLAENGQNLQADILKVPHHGTVGIAPIDFFQMVDPLYVLIPSPLELWCSERSSQVRNWVTENTIPAYVNGYHGNVTVYADNGELWIQTEYGDINDPTCIEK